MIVTLCGSAKFEKEFKHWNETLALAGHAVFSLSVYASDKPLGKDWYTEKEKVTLDKVHKAKIDASDAILVLNVDDYIGESTFSEILYAITKSKLIYLLHPYNALGQYHALKDALPNEPGYRTMCPHRGCYDPLTSKPPCTLCYE